MDVSIINSSDHELSLSLKHIDIGVLYVIQYELINNVDFAGVIVKHPLTNECWMRVNSSHDQPLDKIIKAVDSSIIYVEKMTKQFNNLFGE